MYRDHLLIGPLPPEYGGTTVLFQQLVESPEFLNSIIINTNKYNNYLLKLAYCITKFAYFSTKAKSASLHCSTPTMRYLMPLFYAISKITRCKLSVRKFGGDYYDNMVSPKFTDRLVLSILKKLHAINFETLAEVNHLRKIGFDNVFWYPNTRKKTKFLREKFSSNEELLRVVFVGKVCVEKGVLDLVNSVQNLTGVKVDFYGDASDSTDLVKRINGARNCAFQGQVEPQLIQKTISDYDLLCLPTYYSGEGYPGVILEAYSCGVPVISTYWKCIPEILENGVHGWLVEPKDYLALSDLIKQISTSREVLYDVSSNVKEYFLNFEESSRRKVFIDSVI